MKKDESAGLVRCCIALVFPSQVCVADELLNQSMSRASDEFSVKRVDVKLHPSLLVVLLSV